MRELLGFHIKIPDFSLLTFIIIPAISWKSKINCFVPFSITVNSDYFKCCKVEWIQVFRRPRFVSRDAPLKCAHIILTWHWIFKVQLMFAKAFQNIFHSLLSIALFKYDHNRIRDHLVIICSSVFPNKPKYWSLHIAIIRTCLLINNFNKNGLAFG